MPLVLGDLADSDDDMDAPDFIPAKKAIDPPEEAEEEEDDDDAEDEYRVEKILKHDFKGEDNAVRYRVKWLGYEKASDQTWEPVENLDGAKEILSEYHNSIGGAPTNEDDGSTKKSRGKKRGAADLVDDSPAPASEKKAKRKSKGGANEDEDMSDDKKTLPTGFWENDVTRITSVVEDQKPQTDARGKPAPKHLTAYLLWNSGHKTVHAMPVVRRKCPQKLLDYYEQHLRFLGDDNPSAF